MSTTNEYKDHLEEVVKKLQENPDYSNSLSYRKMFNEISIFIPAASQEYVFSGVTSMDDIIGEIDDFDARDYAEYLYNTADNDDEYPMEIAVSDAQELETTLKAFVDDLVNADKELENGPKKVKNNQERE